MSEASETSLRGKTLDFLAGLPIVIVLAIIANLLSKLNSVIEFVLWAVGLGLLVGNTIPIPDRLRRAFRTEMFIKIGLVLLGARINFWVITVVGAKGLIQALLVVTTVFLVAYYAAIRLGLDKKFAAVLSTAVSVCGVSAAIAAAYSVLADKKQLAYVVSTVVLFAAPSLVIFPYIGRLLVLPDAVAGAWIGGNIDTTPAVVAAGSIYSETAMEVATIIKFAQNVLIGVVAFLLACYYVLVIEKKGEKRPSAMVIWYRFPKFVLGFIAVSILTTMGIFTGTQITVMKNMYKWLFAMTFVCIGLETPLKEFRKIGGKPILAYFIATLYNVALTFVTAWLLFGGILPF
jgi:uncharacterized integral membrane protein (TIGR00698 family)